MSARLSLAGKMLMMLTLCASAGSVGQSQQQTNRPQMPTVPGLTDDQDKLQTPRDMQERQQHARDSDRQKRLVADTEKLLTLATQLHTDVAKTDKNILSLDVVRRADEIEKLAHAVKERMKG